MILISIYIFHMLVLRYKFVRLKNFIMMSKTPEESMGFTSLLATASLWIFPIYLGLVLFSPLGLGYFLAKVIKFTKIKENTFTALVNTTRKNFLFEAFVVTCLTLLYFFL